MFGAESSPRIDRGEARFHAIGDVAPDSLPLVDRKRLERVTFGEPEFRAELLEVVVRSGGLEFAMSLLDRLRAAQTATRAALEAE